ncbi:MAG: M24 family metallopeptidase [Acidimicrobiales bacterium]
MFVPEAVDFDRLCRERHQRLQEQLADAELDAMVLLHQPHVGYATGHPTAMADSSHVLAEPAIAVVVAGEDRPVLFGGRPDRAFCRPDEAVSPILEEDMGRFRAQVAAAAGPTARLAIDQWTGPMLRNQLFDDAVDASPILGRARRVKTADEIACIEAAQLANNRAMTAAAAALVPGTTRGVIVAAFLAALLAEGIDTNLIDPIFQAMPRAVADGPRTTTGGVAFPTGVGDPEYHEGDLIWVDSGVDVCGYASDFGRTWICGRGPDERERELFDRWRGVMTAVQERLRPGVSARELTAAALDAADGVQPWLDHFYLFHGIGVESAEFPMAGTDRGPDADDRIVLESGMVIVLEPVVWRDGIGGYRAEEVVAITDDGYRVLGGGHTYAPFDE